MYCVTTISVPHLVNVHGRRHFHLKEDTQHVAGTSRRMVARIRAAIATLCLCASSALTAQTIEDSDAGIIRHLSNVRTMTPAAAAEALPVRVKAVVIYYSASMRNLFVQDESAGIYIDLLAMPFEFEAGDLLEITGVTDEGNFAPQLIPSGFKKLGSGAGYPGPLDLTLDQALTGSYDSQWVRMSGIVRSIAPEFDVSQLTLASQDRQFDVTVLAPPAEVEHLLDSSITVEGACGAYFNDARQLLGIRLFSPSLDHIKVTRQPAKDSAQLPLRNIQDLSRFNASSDETHRTRVQGVITLAWPGKLLAVQDKSGVATIPTPRSSDDVRPGDLVEVVAYPDVDSRGTQLQDAEVRKIGAAMEPEPEMLADAPEQELHQVGTRVRMRGKLLLISVHSDVVHLTLEKRGREVKATLPFDGTNDEPDFESGSEVEVTGIVSASGDSLSETGSTRILLQSGADVRLISRPKWWTWQHTTLVAFMCSLGILWIVSLRRQVVAQTRQIRDRLENEAALKSDHEYFVDNAADFIFTHDVNGVFTAANKAGEELTGYDRTSLLGMSLFSIITHDSAKGVREVYDRQWGSEDVFRFSVDLLTRDGNERTLEVSARFVIRVGSAVGIQGIARDVTERTQAQRELEETRAFLDTVLENLPLPLFVKEAHTLSFVRTNRAWLDFFGTTSEELLGKTDHDLFQSEEAAFFTAMDRDVMESGELADIPEETVATPNGKRIIHTRKVPIYKDDGDPLYLLGIYVDITDQKAAESKVRETEKLYRKAIAAGGAVPYRLDLASGRYSFVGAGIEALTGFRAEEFTPEVWRRINLEMRIRGVSGTTRFDEAIRAVRDQRHSNCQTDARIRTKDGTIKWVSDSSVHIVNPLGEVIGAIGFLQDITERMNHEAQLERAKEAAEAASHAKGDFLATMSHEIRTPMNGVLGMTAILMDTQLTDEQRDYAQTIQKSADGLLNIINDILDFSKIEAGKMHFEVLDFDLGDVVDTILELHAERSVSSGIELGALIHNDVVRSLRGDPGRLRQVLMNLVSNALKFTQKGQVSIEVRVEKESKTDVALRFEVQDSGVGITADAQERLFKPFSQADSSTTRKFGGTGLGLAISRQIVRLMGGEIGVRSTVGSGSTFWFTAVFTKQADACPKEICTPKDIKGMRVLVVDDNEVNRRIVHYHVVSWGLRNGCAESGPEALQILQREADEGEPYDLVVLDMQMPDMDGMMLAKEIHSDPNIAGVRMLMLTSLGSQFSQESLQEVGISRCLVKPVRQSELYDAFIQTLSPVATATDVALPQPTIAPADASPATCSKTMKILLAEDNTVNRKVALLQLGKLGYKADAVANGAEAVEAARRIRYDIILMDCHMPEMDGFEATRQLRSDPATAQIRIVAMTANAMKGDREKCIDAGMDDYMTKPVNLELLKTVLNNTNTSVDPEPKPDSPKRLNADTLNQLRELSIPGELDALQECVDIFLQTAPENLNDLRTRSAAGELPLVARSAHSLKGSSGNVGGDRLSDLCLQLERAALESDQATVEGLLDQIDREYSELTKLLMTESLGIDSPEATV